MFGTPPAVNHFYFRFSADKLFEMDLKIVLLIVCYGCCAIPNVCGYCTFYYSHYESKRPKLYRNLGDRKELIPIEGLEYRIEEGDLITADCETRIPR